MMIPDSGLLFWATLYTALIPVQSMPLMLGLYQITPI